MGKCAERNIYDEKYDIFSYRFSLFFSSFNRKYLKFIKIDISVFEFKLLNCLYMMAQKERNTYDH